MVENFTPTNEETYNGELKEFDIKVEDSFEKKIKANIQSLIKDPNEKVVENILNYSKSLRK